MPHELRAKAVQGVAVKILISSLVLDLSGTPTYTLTLYNELDKRGHDVTVYSPDSGPLSKQMKTVTSLVGVSPPDLIIAQMNVCAEALREAFPHTRMMFSAHGVTPETEAPPKAEMQHYTAINEDGAENLVAHGVDKVTIIRDFVDTDRFKPTSLPNAELKHVLFISNFKKWKTYHRITKACQKLGLELKCCGSPYGRCHRIEEEINQADLVISTGRGVLEAMSCGRPVVSFNQRCGDGYLTPAMYLESRTRNFAGAKCRYDDLNFDDLIAEIEKYDAADGIVNRYLALMHHDHVLGVDKVMSIMGAGASSTHTVDTLEYITARYKLDLNKKRRMPVQIPNVGRANLPGLFAELDFKVGAEMGVEQGEFSEPLCRENPQATVYGIDPWQSYPGYRDHVSQEQLDGFYEATRKRFVPYPNYRIIKKFSMEALEDFEDGSLDWVYLDGNHTLPFIINDLIGWSQKIRVGGIVSGHDYRKSRRIVSQNHVAYAVECFTQAYRIRPWFVLGSKEKIPGMVRDNTRSWMWVKK